EQRRDPRPIVEGRPPEEPAVTPRERPQRRRSRVDAKDVDGAVAVEVAGRLTSAEQPPGDRGRTPEHLDVLLDVGPDLRESVAVEVGRAGPGDRAHGVDRRAGADREDLERVRFPVTAVFDQQLRPAVRPRVPPLQGAEGPELTGAGEPVYPQPEPAAIRAGERLDEDVVGRE